MGPATALSSVQRVKSKVCLVGANAVGKTSLVRRFVNDEFDDRYIATLGAKVSKREQTLAATDGSVTYRMDMTLWDIMGDRGFRDLLQDAFFHGAKGVLAVADLTRYSSLTELADWIRNVFDVVGPIPVVYAVNKADLKGEGTVLYGDREIEEAARAFGAPFFYTSAKTGEGVEHAFHRLGTLVLGHEGVSGLGLNPENRPRSVK